MSFREARIKSGLSVRDVMKETGLSDAAIYQWETGQTIPRGTLLPKIAKLYGCSVDELLKQDE